MKSVLDAAADKYEMDGECFVWTGSRNYAGYGIMNRNYKLRKAHREVYEATVGPIPEGLVIDHLCGNKACINPDHLEPVTQQENIRRGTAPAAINARKTHCKNGHEFSDDNTVVRGDGGRECRTCAKARVA